MVDYLRPEIDKIWIKLLSTSCFCLAISAILSCENSSDEFSGSSKPSLTVSGETSFSISIVSDFDEMSALLGEGSFFSV